MTPRIPSWLVQVVSLVVVWLGLAPLLDALLYWIVTRGLPDLFLMLPFVLLFVGGLLLLLWDFLRRREEPKPSRAASMAAYARMAVSFLVLFAAATVAGAVWPIRVPQSPIYDPLASIAGAGIVGIVVSGFAYFTARGGTGA